MDTIELIQTVFYILSVGLMALCFFLEKEKAWEWRERDAIHSERQRIAWCIVAGIYEHLYRDEKDYMNKKEVMSNLADLIDVYGMRHHRVSLGKAAAEQKDDEFPDS